MKYKNTILAIVGTVLASTSGYGVYKTIDSNQKIDELKQETTLLKSENDKLVTDKNKKEKELETVSKKLKKSEKEIVSLKKESKSNENNDITKEQPNEQVAVTPNTDYMTAEMKEKLDETTKQAREEREAAEKAQQEKENEPQYATYSDDIRSPMQFSLENGLTYGELQDLNPGVEITKGNSYRIK
ncbi:hypothetical protein P7H60_13650 [Vagococcus carniphilus]|uniref:hypothetical protein n=1 Tax=Vagococcus carniphilus TaxID=218144 RepID=UPI00289223D9|nr:hypothetical protein [Vagococcus carniphilus]MDT2850194.1 hypothetical protein [Vagococcus carniphilus]